MNQPLTLDQVIEQLIKLREAYPEYGRRPVHILDMDGDNGDCLITEIETDCFDEQQGPVTSLMSWRSGSATS